MAQSKNTRWSDKTTTEKIAFVIVATIVAFIAVVVLISLTNGSNTNSNGDSVSSREKAAEKACQDVAVIKTQGRNISVIDMWNYNLTFTDDIGDGMSSIQWSGKNNDTDGRVLFVCDVSGVDDNLTVNSLTMSGERLQ